MTADSPSWAPRKYTLGKSKWYSVSSWCKRLVFYTIFHAFLAAFFSAMMMLFYQTLDNDYMPKYTPGDGGSLLRNPSLAIRPLPTFDTFGPIPILYANGEDYEVRHFTESLNEFIRPYEVDDVISGQHLIECSEEYGPGEYDVCRFQHTWLTGKCNKHEMWGFNTRSPCIILKLNRMINWEPVVYESVEELPEDMPQSLKEHIHRRTEDNNGVTPKMIWVSCQGETAADEENIGSLSYSPWQGFPAYYFPFRNYPGYLSPLVAVQFNQSTPNVLISVECRAWAKNIPHNRRNRLGLIPFELLID